MSIEMKDSSSGIDDIDIVEGIFLNAMICTLKEAATQSCWIPDGKLPEVVTKSVMKIGHSHIRDLAIMMTLMERDTTLNQQPDSDEKHASLVRRSEIHIAEAVWSFAEAMGTSSTFCDGNTQMVSSGALGGDGIPFVSKDLCTFHDWLLINSILERPEIDSPSSNALYGLMQSLVDCYRQNCKL